MGWFELFRDLGIFGICAWLFQHLIENRSNEQIEKYKQELDLVANSHQQVLDFGLEKYKNELRLIGLKQSSLHNKRWVVVKDIYKNLITLDSAMRHMVSPRMIIDSEDVEATTREIELKAQQALADFNNHYLFNKLYFSGNLGDLLEKIRGDYQQANFDFFELRRLRSILGDFASLQLVADAEHKVHIAGQKIRDHIPESLKELEAEFQKL